MTPAQQEMQILRKYAVGGALLAVAADCGVSIDVVSEVASAVGFQRARAAQLVREYDAATFNRHVLNGRLTRPHPAGPGRPTAAAAPRLLAFVRWEEPPPPKSTPPRGSRQHTDRDAVAARLRTQPGEWAVIYEGATRWPGISTQIRGGYQSCFEPAGAFDTRERLVDGVHRIYAIYLGEGGA